MLHWCLVISNQLLGVFRLIFHLNFME